MTSIPITLALAAVLSSGTVQTRDGRTLQGELQMEDGAILLPGTNGGSVRLLWTDILQVRFTNAPPPQKLVGTGTGPLPAGWESRDIGPVHQQGNAVCDASGLLTVKTSGWGAWGPEDSFHFVFRPLAGDGQIIARILRANDAPARLTAGVMIRESLAAGAPMAGATLHPNGEVRLSQRLPRRAREFAPPAEAMPHWWVRLTRRGQEFTVYCSTDGRLWEQVERRTLEMKPDALAGLAAWTAQNASLGEMQMDSIQLHAGPPEDAWIASGDGLRPGLVFRDGSAVAGTIRSLGTNGVQFLSTGRSFEVPWEKIAKLVFNPAPADAGSARPTPGILLTSGAYLEGELTSLGEPRQNGSRRLSQLKVAVSSVLFGVKAFEAPREVVLVNVAPVKPTPAAFEVRTVDGSVIRAKTVEIRQDRILVDGKDMNDPLEITRL